MEFRLNRKKHGFLHLFGLFLNVGFKFSKYSFTNCETNVFFFFLFNLYDSDHSNFFKKFGIEERSYLCHYYTNYKFM